MDKDKLIVSEIYYKDNPDGIGNIQLVKDSGNYVIDKMTGLVTDTVLGFVPRTSENKYIWVVGQSKEGGLFFGTKTSQFTIAEDYNGYKIVLQEWDKNIRHSNSELNSVLIFKSNKQLAERCLPRIFDFAYDKRAVYIYSNGEIYKFNFDELTKLPTE